MFALSKAEDARDKLADVSNGDARELVVDLEGSEYDVAEVGTALREVIEQRMHEQRVELRDRLQRR